jgi:hypothetical protein
MKKIIRVSRTNSIVRERRDANSQTRPPSVPVTSKWPFFLTPKAMRKFRERHFGGNRLISVAFKAVKVRRIVERDLWGACQISFVRLPGLWGLGSVAFQRYFTTPASAHAKRILSRGTIGTKRDEKTHQRDMRPHLFALIVGLNVAAAVSTGSVHAQTPEPDEAILAALTNHEYNLEGEGQQVLLNEAKSSDFFLLGELHGDSEIPARFLRAFGLTCGSRATAT